MLAVMRFCLDSGAPEQPSRTIAGMFAAAYEIASRFTVPVVVSSRLHDGTVECGIGAAIVVDRQGWVVTAAHMLQALELVPEHTAEITAYDAAVAEIMRGRGDAAAKRDSIGALGEGTGGSGTPRSGSGGTTG
jgi:hypothetical protein